nr:helix-turn-helix domain-containing protein [Corynebacterium ulcerans]
MSRFCALVTAGSSVRSVARAVELPLSVAYRLTHELELPVRCSTRISRTESESIAKLWREGFAPMGIVRAPSVGASTVYRIGVELGLWQRSEHGRTAHATTRRCEYLQLRANALGCKDAAQACGIHPRHTVDIDEGLIRLKDGRRPFIPHGPDVALYKSLTQVIPYVDGREAVSGQVIPQARIGQRISTRYLGVEGREIIFDLKRQGTKVREIARRLKRSPGTISKELLATKTNLGCTYPRMHTANQCCAGSGPSSARSMPIHTYATKCGSC